MATGFGLSEIVVNILISLSMIVLSSFIYLISYFILIIYLKTKSLKLFRFWTERGSFPFDGLWKNQWKIHISFCIFPLSIRKSTSLFGEMVNEKIMSFWSYLSPMSLLRKAVLFFFLFFNVKYDSLKGFCLCIVDTRRRNIFFIRNKSSSFVIYIVERHYGVKLNSNLL